MYQQNISPNFLIKNNRKFFIFYLYLFFLVLIYGSIYFLLSSLAKAYPAIHRDYPILFSPRGSYSEPNQSFFQFLIFAGITTFSVILYASGFFIQTSNVSKNKHAIRRIIGVRKTEKTNKLAIVDSDLENLKTQLHSELNRLKRFSYINLGVGFITTIISIFILYNTLSTDIQKFNIPDSLSEEVSNLDSDKYDNSPIELDHYLMHMIPRVSLSILIEIFAFFFLRLYKQNFNDIKYYTNEIINIDMKIIGLKTAASYDTNIENVINTFVNTERNFVLKKDESTVEIQKQLVENNNNDKIFDVLNKIFGNKG